jgi:8-oxo-dGTP diphosphatase
MRSNFFKNVHNPKNNQRVTAYIIRVWEGEPQPTDEAKTIQWFRIDRLPIERMWHDNTIWLPPVLLGKKVRGNFIIGEDDRVIEHKLEEI